MNAKREFVDIGTLPSKIEDTDLGVRDTTVESRLGIWLPDVSESCVNKRSTLLTLFLQ